MNEEIYEEEVDQETQSAEETQQPPQSQQDQNWNQARQVMEAQKNELEALRRQMSEFSAHRQQNQAPEQDEFADLDPNDYVTVEKAKALATKQAKQAAQEIIKDYLAKDSAQRKFAETEREARSKFDDYDYVINTYVLPELNNDPALAHKIQQSKNPALTAYKIGMLEMEERGQAAPINPKAERILKNSQRPVSGSAVSAPLKAQAEQFSKMSQSDVWKLSESYAKKAY